MTRFTLLPKTTDEAAMERAKDLLRTLRKERARIGLRGYDPARHRAVVAELRRLQQAVPTIACFLPRVGK